jgi:hypothetical protein
MERARLRLLLSLWLALAGPDDLTDAGSPAVAPLAFSFEECAPLVARDIERLLRADVAWAPGDPTTVIRVRCEALGVRIALTVDDDQTVDRFVDLTGIGDDARPRTVALIAAEMLLLARGQTTMVPLRKTDASGTSRDAEPPPAPSAPAPAAAIAQPPAPPSPAASPSPYGLLAVGAISLHEISAGTPLYAVGGRFRYEGQTGFGISLDATGLFQRMTSPAVVALAVGGGFIAAAEARTEFPGGRLRAGLGVRAVALRLSASPRTTDTGAGSAWGSSVGPVMRLGGSWVGAAHLIDVILDAGWCGPEITGTLSGDPAIGVGGWWAGASVGAGGFVGD